MADESAAVTPEASTTGGVSVEMPNHTPVVEAAPVDFSSIIPEGFTDKAWVDDVKDIPGLFKMTDDLKSKLGERPAGIPHENSTPEEKSAFNKAFGVPEKAEDFKLSEPIKGHEDFQNRIKDMFHKADLNQDQAASLDEGWNELMQQLTPDPEAQNADFDKMADELFGDTKDKVLETSKALLEEHAKDLPEGTRDAFNNLPNNVLVPLAAVLNSIQSKYINEDDIPNGGGSVAPQSVEEKSKERYNLMASDAWKDKSHPNHAKVAARVTELYGT